MSLNKEIIISPSRREQIYQFIKKLNIDSIHIKKIKEENSQNLYLIDEALTHTSANSLVNHERLEFLGDAVLRLAATEFIEMNFPSMDVGDRSALRSELVSDKWLTKVGRSLAIDKVLVVGNKASGDKSAIETLQAESTEALIGAMYECLQNLEAIHQWLKPYWEEESASVLSNPYKNNSKSALQEWSQKRGLKLPEYHLEELNKKHGNSKRFFCKVHIDGKAIGEGWGGSRKEAEKEAAKMAIASLEAIKTN
tara:strand:- start:2148 stop:2906 length:759 start_codon:yes stop_codon:yes gene_type:complete